MGETAPTLWLRKSQQHRQDAKEYGINILQGRPLDPAGVFAQMSMDVSGSTPSNVYSFLTQSLAVSVSLQPQDAGCYLRHETELVRSMVQNNFSKFFSGELEPSEISEAFKRATLACMSYVPVAAPQAPDPDRAERERMGEDKFRTLHDETFMEWSQANNAREAEERSRFAADPWDMSF
jgi:hypothetical protein